MSTIASLSLKSQNFDINRAIQESCSGPELCKSGRYWTLKQIQSWFVFHGPKTTIIHLSYT